MYSGWGGGGGGGVTWFKIGGGGKGILLRGHNFLKAVYKLLKGHLNGCGLIGYVLVVRYPILPQPFLGHLRMSQLLGTYCISLVLDLEYL